MNYRVIAIVSLIICLEIAACNAVAPITPLIEPVKSLTLAFETQIPISTNTTLPPSKTLTAFPKLLPVLAPITPENANDISLLLTLEIPDYTPRTSSQCGVDYSPNGSAITCGGVDKIITLWDTDSGEKMAEFGEHDSKIWDLEFNPDGKTIVTASFAHNVRLWEVDSREMMWSFDAITNLLSVEFDPSGSSVACGNLWGKIGVLDAQTGEIISELSGPPGTPVGDINFSPSGKLLAAGSDDNKIYLWGGEDFKPLAALEGHNGFVNGMNFNPDEKLLISGSHDKTVGIWDIENQQLLKKLEGHQKVVLRVAYNPQGTLIASISWDGTVRLWRVVEV